MTLQEIIQIIQNDWGKWVCIVVLVSGLIEISPIKVNPWRYLVKLISSILYSHSDNIAKETNENVSKICESVKSLEERITKLETNIDDMNASMKNIKTQTDTMTSKLNDHVEESKHQRIEEMRTTILNFANSCMNKQRHTEEEFVYMIGLCDRYEMYCKENDLINGVADVAMREIRRIYQKIREKGTFLQEGED